MSKRILNTITSSHNWSGHIRFNAVRFHKPNTITELQTMVREAKKVRVIGSRHSFNDIADTDGDLVWLGDLKQEIQIDKYNKKVTVPAGITYGELCPVLDKAGYALPNLASLTHITVAGACMTATHGSGNSMGNLATAVSGIEMVTASGDLVTLSRQNNKEIFEGSVISLGALGVVTKITLDLQPSFMVQQDAYEQLPFKELYLNFDEITGAAYSVSLFPTWQHDFCDTLWLKRLTENKASLDIPETFFGAKYRSPEIASQTSEDRILTPFGKPHPWHEQLPHYTLHKPIEEGNELQSEYFVDRECAVDAIKAIQKLKSGLKEVLGLSEIRTIAGDNLWLSPAFGKDIVGIHFNWLKKWEDLKEFLPVLEKVIEPFNARPHMGKLFAMSPETLDKVYPRWSDFRKLAREYDPEGKFSNRFINKYVYNK